MPPLRLTLLFLTVAVPIFFWSALNPDASYSVVRSNTHGPPDFERYTNIRVLSPEEFPIGDPDRRVIIVGDIHGMDGPFKQLLTKAAYDEGRDVLVHLGDIIAKGSHRGSLAIIDYMTQHNITGVRGNHDQEVIEWRGWQNWFATLHGGNEWLSDLHLHWEKAKARGEKLKHWMKIHRKESRGDDAKWWSLIPEDWIPFEDHYLVAQDLTKEQYSYLVSLPLKLHVPSVHAFIIHAGLLPYNLRYDFDDHKRQPLAQVPHIRADVTKFNDETREALRTLQEHSILRRVTHNTEPWVNLNIRSVVKDKKISRSASEGVPWTDYWNDQMSMCAGFKHERDIQIHSDASLHLDDPESVKLPCYPSSVIYGHCAKRGLDIGRWTFGLDTGCVAGGKLTAMILGPKSSLSQSYNEGDDDSAALDGRWDDDHFEDTDGIVDEDDERDTYVAPKSPFIPEQPNTIQFGESGDATIVHVSCQRRS